MINSIECYNEMIKTINKSNNKPTTFWEYIDTLEDGTDKWRKAMDLGSKYHKIGKNPDEYLEEIIKNVEKN